MANESNPNPIANFYNNLFNGKKTSPSSDSSNSSNSSNLLDNESPDTKPNNQEQSLAERENNLPEKNPSTSFYNPKQGTSKSKKSKLSTKILKKAPTLFILGALVLGGVLIIIFALPLILDSFNNVTEATDVQYPAAKAAESAVTEELMATGSIPSGFAERLTNSGLEVGYLNDNQFIAGLRPSSDNSIALTKSSSEQPQKDNSLVIRFKGNIITASEFAQTLETDLEFRSGFNQATGGRATYYYDEAMDEALKTYKITRDRFSNYTSSNDIKTDTKNFRENYFNKVFEGGVESISKSTLSSSLAEDENYINKNANTTLDESLIPSDTPNREETYQYLSKIYDVAKSSHEEDTVGNMTTLINDALNANETYHSMQFFMLIMEPISKTKAGNGAYAPINPVLNFLTTSTTTKTPDMENGGFKEVTGAPVQSPALSSILTKTYSSNLPAKTSGYSSDRVLTSANQIVDMTKTENGPLDRTLLSVSTSSSSIVKDASYVVIENVSNTKQEIISKFIGLITPSISQSLLIDDDFEKSLSGINAGEFFSKGAAAFGYHTATFAQGGTIGDTEAITAYNNYTDRVLALDAAADRKNRSPFDITSKNTFLGSIFANIGTKIITSNSLLSTFSSLSSLTNSSLSSLLPGAFAASNDDKKTYQTTYGNCPSLDRIQVKGDIFCNPIITFDISTISTAIASNEFNEYLAKNLTTETLQNNSINLTAKITIPDSNNGESDIGDMLTYNNGNISIFGTKNAGIYQEIDESQGLIDSIISAIESLFSKIASFFTEEPYNEYSNAEASAYATGEQFSNSKNNSDNWNNRYKYAQAYMVYDRVLNAMEYFSESNTNTSALSQYFQPGTGQSPTATYLASMADEINSLSDTEYLAKISGMTNTEAESVLAYLAYNSYLASINYDSYCTAEGLYCQTKITPPIKLASNNQLPSNFLTNTTNTTTFYRKQEATTTA